MSTPLMPEAIGRAAISATEQVPEAVLPAASRAQPLPRRCLIVDDSRVVRRVSRQIVESLGYQVIEAENGQEALARCRIDLPDLILLDWEMPMMSGIDFITALRALALPHRPKAVFCTSRGETSDIYKGIEAGADEYVIKPFTETTLKAKLERIGAV